MNLGAVIRSRLVELGLEQKDLAAAADVTESYISQLLTRKKAPPAPERTDIYGKFEAFLRLPENKLVRLARHERGQELKRAIEDLPPPLHAEVRELILRTCSPVKDREIRTIFEKEPFGALEQLVTRKLLEAVKHAARKELENESWLHAIARGTGRSYKEMRVLVLEFLDTDVLTVSVEDCDAFMVPLIESWDIDLTSFAMEIVLNPQLAPGHSTRLDFVARRLDDPSGAEPGFEAFLGDPLLSGDATEEEIDFLKALRFTGRRPTALYYYRALQNLRDPLHFDRE